MVAARLFEARLMALDQAKLDAIAAKMDAKKTYKVVEYRDYDDADAGRSPRRVVGRGYKSVSDAEREIPRQRYGLAYRVEEE